MVKEIAAWKNGVTFRVSVLEFQDLKASCLESGCETKENENLHFYCALYE